MDYLQEGFQIAVFGVVVVLLSLYLMSVVLRLFELLFSERETSADIDLPENKEELSEDLVLALSAVMAEVVDDDEYILNIQEID